MKIKLTNVYKHEICKILVLNLLLIEKNLHNTHSMRIHEIFCYLGFYVKTSFGGNFDVKSISRKKSNKQKNG